MHHPVIEVNNVSVSYRDHLALEHVTFKVHEQSFVAVAGPNGAGKTTLLTCINGLGRLYRGSVSIYGRPVNAATVNAIRKEIAYLPQSSLIDNRVPMRVADVVRMGRVGRAGFFKRLDKHDDQLVNEAAEMVGIEKLLHRPIGHLSGGEQRKVALARCLAQQPKILLLDEPLSNLDITAQASLLGLIDRIYAQTHLTTVMVIHNFDLLPRLLNRVILLKAGSIMLDDVPQKAFQPQTLSQLYGCSVTVSGYNGGLIVRAGQNAPGGAR